MVKCCCMIILPPANAGDLGLISLAVDFAVRNDITVPHVDPRFSDRRRIPVHSHSEVGPTFAQDHDTSSAATMSTNLSRAPSHCSMHHQSTLTSRNSTIRLARRRTLLARTASRSSAISATAQITSRWIVRRRFADVCFCSCIDNREALATHCFDPCFAFIMDDALGYRFA